LNYIAEPNPGALGIPPKVDSGEFNKYNPGAFGGPLIPF